MQKLLFSGPDTPEAALLRDVRTSPERNEDRLRVVDGFDSLLMTYLSKGRCCCKYGPKGGAENARERVRARGRDGGNCLGHQWPSCGPPVFLPLSWATSH
jgi:hypothetical protein